MVENSALQQVSPSSNQPKPSIIDDLFNLTASRDLDVMLGRALRMTTRILGAEAGSILFKAQPSRTIQSGAFRQEALAHVEHWEEVIGKRLQETEWKISSTATPPISVVTLPNSNLVMVNIPLLQDTDVVGSLSLVLTPGSELTSNHRTLLTRIAKGLGQIASLIADLELANRRLHQLSVFYDVGQALVTTFDIGKLLVETMELATDLIDAGASSIMLLDEEKKELVFKVSHGNRRNALRQQRIPLDEGIGGWVARHGRPVIANDARADHRFSHRVDVRTGFLTQSIAAVPLEIKGRIIGIMEVLNKYSGGGFDQEDIQLMSSIARQAAIAIENARLYQEVFDERDRIIAIQEETRQELVRNLEEGQVQLLSAISMGLDHLDRLSASANPEVVQNQISALRNLVNQATYNTYNMLFELHPVTLEVQGLLVTCEQYINQLQRTESFSIHYDDNVKQAEFSTKIAAVIFGIVQEAINNVKRHANADDVWVSLETEENLFKVTIRDNGQGFDTETIDALLEKQTAYGLLNMRERAASIRAELQIESNTKAPNQGTVVHLSMPWPS